MSDQYHLSMKQISRKAGRSATAAAAYRAAELIVDERTGEVHDYRRKKGVEHSYVVLPGGGTMGRAALWNAVEKKHKRGDAILVREIEIAIPAGLDAGQRRALLERYAAELADRYGVAVDVAIHEPHPVTDADLERDPSQHYVEEVEVLKDGAEVVRRHNGNFHAHVMLSACLMSPEGVPGKKAELLDQIHCQRAKIPNPAQVERPRWAELANAALAAAGSADRIDHRSHEARGIERVPTAHRGPAATAIRRRGQASRLSQADQAAQAAAKAAAEAQAEAQAAVDAAVAELAEAQAVLAAELLELEAQAAASAAGQAGASGAGPARAAEAGQAAPVLAIGPAPAEADRPAPGRGGLRAPSAAEMAALHARQRAQREARRAAEAAQAAHPPQAQEAPQGEPRSGVAEDRRAVRATSGQPAAAMPADSPGRHAGRDVRTPPPALRAIKTQAPAPGTLRMAPDERVAEALAAIERYGLGELQDGYVDTVLELMLARLKAIQDDRRAIMQAGGPGAGVAWAAHRRDNLAEAEALSEHVQAVREFIAQRQRGDIDD